MVKATLYGVGVGPGDPKLMTLKAVDVIARCPVIAAPRTRNGGMVALDIAKGAVDLSGKTILPLDFAMSRDAAICAASHREAASLVRNCLDDGKPVAMLNLGDVSIYASFRYITDILAPEGYPIEMVSGVPSFCAAAAVLGTSLTDMDTPLRIVPDGTAAPDALDGDATTVWMKSGRNLSGLLRTLEEAGVAERAMLVQNCGMPNQNVRCGVAGAAVDPAYFSLVILKNGAKELS